ncbi:hypothetical protein HK098_005965, partial [Nowakowskiella sp. JEL0407]
SFYQIIYRDMKQSSTLRDIEIIFTHYISRIRCKIARMPDDFYAIDNLKTMHIDFEPDALLPLLESLKTNQTVKELKFRVTCGRKLIYKTVNQILAQKTAIETVSISYSYDFLEIKSLVDAILGNLESNVKRLMLSNGELEIEVDFRGCRVGKQLSVMIFRKFRKNRDEMMKDVVKRVLNSWDEGVSENILVDCIVLDPLTHVELKNFLGSKVLRLDKRMEKNEKIQFGYKDRSMCL